MASAGAVSNDKGFVIIVNKANPVASLKRPKVAATFMRQVSRWPFGAEIVPIDLPEKSAIHAAFLKTILKTSLDDLKAYWIDQKLTHNIDPPMRVADPAEARRIVASKPGAIAYIPAEAADDTVKVLTVE